MNNLPADKNWRVLVIDDNRSIHDDFRKILSPPTAATVALDSAESELFGRPTDTVRQSWFEVDSAYQGQEGVLLVKRALEAGLPYAMAFVDVRMPPGWDGVETTRKIWELDPNLQIVLCTAYSDYSWDEMFKKLGRRGGLLILKKPFDGVEAFQLAHALTEKWWLHQQSRRKMEELESRVAVRTSELRESQALYHSLVEQLPAGIFRKDAAGRFVLVNPWFCQLKRMPADQILGRTALEITTRESQNLKTMWYPELATQGSLHHEQIMRTGQPIELEETYAGADGHPQHLQIVKSAVFGPDKKIIGSQGVLFDITGRKRAEEAVRESEERFSGAFEYAPIGVALVSPEGRWLKVNRAVCDLVGYSEAELLTRTFQDITHPEDLEVDLANVRRLIAGEIPSYQMEKRYVHARGHFVSVLLSVSLVRDGQGQPRYFISQIQDITERKLVEKSLRESDEKFHQLADNITDAFWIRSPDMREVHYISPAFERIWGRSVESLYANPHQWADFILQEDRERVVGAFAALTGDVRNLDVEYRIMRPDGEIRWVRVRGFQVRDAADKLVRHTGIVTDITERRRAEEARMETSALLETLLRNTTDGIYFKDMECRFVHFSRKMMETFHLTRPDELKGRTDFDFFSEEHARPAFEAEQEIIRTGKPILNLEEKETHLDGRIIWVSTSKMAWRDNAGNIIGTMGISRDITERKQIENQLFQSQKMETVGKLAGGIAHEFNSILTAIIGQSELLLNDLPPANPLCKNVTEISKAAGRAVTLTRQLLAYGRKQLLQPEILDLNQVIASMEGMFHHLTGGKVDTRIVAAPGLQAVRADAGQIEQVIMNMAINARDAMPNGGKLTLETANVSFARESADRHPELKPGDYVMLAISDTGTGMSEEVRARVFEPFFSTKGVGEGTGLGLSTCYGIVKQSGGHISVHSEPGRGATFKIYLPQVERQAKIPIQRLETPGLPRGTETILLAEDDPALREMAATLLRRLGYNVLTAGDGVEVLSLSHQRDASHIDLLFTDVVIPNMSGKELADRMRALYPHTRILFTSACIENAIGHQGTLNKHVALLQKPFTPSALALKVREVLDQPGAPEPDTARKAADFTPTVDGANTP